MATDISSVLLDRVELVPDAEVAAVLAAAICDGRAGTMTREAAVFLAGACADFLVERMALAGLVVVRRLDSPGYNGVRRVISVKATT